MKLVADIHNWHRWRSVQFGLLAAACGTGMAAYAFAYGISPSVVSGIPHWLVTMLALGSMVLPLASVLWRGIAQSNLPSPPDDGQEGNDR